jgi:lauroyl/myristoyl acyltransferase
LAGSIVYSFHYGPYRLLPRYLVAAGYKLTIVVSSAVLNRERMRYARDLATMGAPADSLECLEASDTMVIRKMLQAISLNRLILVFLDANESVGTNESKEEQGRLRVFFGGSYFYWRSNLLKLAHRFGLPVYAIHLSPKLHHTEPAWQMGNPINILTSADKNNPMAILNAFTKLQEIFQAMMHNDWTAWENWGLMHHYKGFDERTGSGTKCKGSWMIPFSFSDKGYLFDLSRKIFYEIIVKKSDIF